ncbi:MAG: alpha-amylase [Methanofollis sp.]|nr:alpha-amylase [Methanofollis sp.]
MANLCLGFEVHQPFRLNASFRPEKAKGQRDLKSLYFDPGNRTILKRVAERSYVPAARLLIDALDRGLRCSFSFSGVLIEQLEAWCPRALALFTEAGSHQNAEVLAQTYYHSLAGFFADLDEFEMQIGMHVDLMADLFGRRPRVAENTEFSLDAGIVAAIRDLGFSAVYTEGIDRLLGGRTPNETYVCDGMPVLLRNCPLSDDIAFRFSWKDWDKQPLTAEKYASWIALSPGRCAHVFVDFETFGEHQPTGSGIFGFLAALPDALDGAGVRCVLPSEAASSPPAGKIEFQEPVSWADLEKDTSAWLGTPLQRSAFLALEHSPARKIRPEIWRYLGTSDHFYYLASKAGSCGEVHRHFCPNGRTEYYETFMRILSHLERRCLPRAKQSLASLPPERSFHFSYPDGTYAGWSAHSLLEFETALEQAPADAVNRHFACGDFSRWIEESFAERRLAGQVAACTTVDAVKKAVHARRCALCGR